MGHRCATGVPQGVPQVCPQTTLLKLMFHRGIGFVEGRMALSLGANFANGGTTASLGYVNQLGNPEDNQRMDRDYVTLNISHAF